jgi:hypothetical protein
VIVKLKIRRFLRRRAKVQDVRAEVEDQLKRAEPFFTSWYEESVSSWRESEAKKKGAPPPLPLAKVENALVLDGTVYFPTGYDRKEAVRRCESGEFGSLHAAFFFVNELGGKTHLHLRPFDWEKFKLG